MKNILPVNENILRTRFPVVLQRIHEIGDRKSETFYYDDTVEGNCLMIQRGEHSFAAYGRGKSDQLVKRWFRGLTMAKESLYAISGFGDGSHVRLFMQETSSGTNFLVAEKDPALLRETFARYDCSDILLNERFMLGVGEANDEFFKDIQGAAITGVNDINSIIFSPLHSVDEGYYDNVRNELLRQYMVVRPLMEVNVRTATDIQENTFRNLPHLAHAPDIGEMEGEFKDIPFVLVGAGPSLDESIDFLKQVQDRAIIITSNSPYRKLINNGIRPHMVVTADPLSPTLAGFENITLDGVPLACPFSAYPEIVKRFSGRIMTWCTFNPIVDILKDRTGRKPGTNILEKGTVSACVLDISRLLGSRKVLLVGQDMAIRDDGRYYSDDTSYSDSGAHYASTEKGHRLPGNTQDKVIVEGRLFVYLKTFEQFISENPNVEYRNLARTGVKINGAPYMTFEEAEGWVGESTSASFDDRTHELLSKQGDSSDLATIYSPAIQYVEKILSMALECAIKTELLPDKYSGTNYSENKQIKELLADANKVNALVDSNKSFWNFLFEGKTKGELVNYRRRIRDIEFPNPNWTAVQRNKEFFWALSEGSNWLLNKTSQFIPANSKAVTETN
ncbi:MAG: DUF115 domain-containing protein [Opitutales bacterium]|nr:DUF115 domain-containing protein [Opitutales bacterium]